MSEGHELNTEQLASAMSARIARSQGTLFVGSGISAGSGLPTWFQLLEKPANDVLQIKLRPGDDLPAIAQYVLNVSNGNRRVLLDSFFDFADRSIQPNAYHHWISMMVGLRTIWTTNYDTLLEQALSGRRIVVRHEESSFQRVLPSGAIEIVKLHGCAERSSAAGLVITTADYEDFEVSRPALCNRLSSELMSSSVLFVGYSYQDPNIRTALVQARRLMGESPPQHYLLMRPPSDESDPRFGHWCRDLSRVGIEVVLAQDHSEVEWTLREIALRSRGRTVYVTGSHVVSDEHLVLPEDLGRRLAGLPTVVLLDGQSEGIGRAAVEAFSKACVAQHQDLTDRLRIYPNPYAVNPHFAERAELVPELKQLRSSLLSGTRVVVALPGGMGTAAEVEEARRLGCLVVPVPLNGDPESLGVLELEAHRLPDQYVAAARDGALSPELIVECVRECLG